MIETSVKKGENSEKKKWMGGTEGVHEKESDDTSDADCSKTTINKKTRRME